VVTVPVIGEVMRAFAAGANLPGRDARIGGPGYREWLLEQAGCGGGP
jgi:hypothetical protein